MQHFIAPEKSRIGNRMAVAIMSAGFSINAFCDTHNLPKTSVKRWCAGEVTLDGILTIAHHLQISPREFL